jgi:hypothetical protein
MNKPGTKSIDNVKDLHKLYQTINITIEKIAADVVVSSGRYLFENKI